MALEPRKILEALKSGQPISGEEGMSILTPACGQAIGPHTRAVVRSRGINASRRRETYWITGRSGNGKSQALQQFMFQLPLLEGASKYSHVFIDFDNKPSARGPEGLIPAIVRNALATGQMVEVNTVCERIVKSTPTEEAVRGTLAFGIDVISAIAQAPPSSLFVAQGMRRLLLTWRMRTRYIIKKLKERIPSEPNLLLLLSKWVSYLLNPTLDKEKSYSQIIDDLGTKGVLFHMFCFLLENAGYSTLVLAFDEVDRVALKSLKDLWNPPKKENNPYFHNLSIIFIFSAQPEIWEHASNDISLCRRFCETNDGYYILKGPSIHDSPPDDLSHIEDKVNWLISQSPNLSRQMTDDLRSQLAILREKLKSKNNLTWHELWRSVIDLLAEI